MDEGEFHVDTRVHEGLVRCAESRRKRCLHLSIAYVSQHTFPVLTVQHHHVNLPRYKIVAVANRKVERRAGGRGLKSALRYIIDMVL